ncbi:MAG: hypothetical protein JO307_13430 [Bryobacterales bacterium]|nr:hypothetical protein [Bryobacterales bacterium]
MKSAAIFFSSAAVCWSQPIISAVEDAASNIPLKTFGSPPSFANASIAQGSMFVVKGNGLGPASIVVANSYPLQTTLAGTSIQIVVSGTATNAIMYYTQAQQVAAILPSSTPVGAGHISVYYNGQYNSFDIYVVQNNVAMYTVDESGGGDAVITLADNSLVMPNNAPNPGDTVVFLANGLGPVSDDESLPATGGDMTSVPLEVFIGGQPAKVLYRGRNTCCVSLDQINVQIPQNVSTGCVVSVTMRIGTLVSNTTTMPIRSSGRVCTPTNPAISQADVQHLMSQKSLNIGIISLERSIPRSGVDVLTPSFKKVSGLPSLVLDELVDVPAPGSCTVTYNFVGNNWYLKLPNANLDAGSIALSGPTGVIAIPNNGGRFLDPGPYTATAAGGADIGAFQMVERVPPAFTWNYLNNSTIETFDRTQGITVTWSGANSSSYVTISGYGNDASSTTFFSCTARVSDGSFTVPPLVLQSLPADGTIMGAVEIEAVSIQAPFAAKGLDFGIAWAAEYDASGLGTVVFQ